MAKSELSSKPPVDKLPPAPPRMRSVEIPANTDKDGTRDGSAGVTGSLCAAVKHLRGQ